MPLTKRKSNTTEINSNKKITTDVENREEMEDLEFRENDGGEEDYSDSDFGQTFDDYNDERTLEELAEDVEENVNDVNEIEAIKLMVTEGKFFYYF